MEDEHVIVKNFREIIKDQCPTAAYDVNVSYDTRDCPMIFCGVYDGHGGKQAATYCRENMHLNVAAQMTPGTDLEQAMKHGLVKTEADYLDEATKNKDYSGSVCNFLVLCGREVYVANLGDARAVLCRGGAHVDLSHDHKPTQLEEVKRVEKLGGTGACPFCRPPVFLNGELPGLTCSNMRVFAKEDPFQWSTATSTG